MGSAIDPQDAGERFTVTEVMRWVMRDIGAVPKTQRHQQQGYAFRGVDDVVNAVAGPFTHHGMFVAPRVRSIVRDTYQTANNVTMHRVTIRVRYRFYGPAGDYVTAETAGEGADTAAGAVSKAMSEAYKLALIEVLAIPTVPPPASVASGSEANGEAADDPDATMLQLHNLVTQGVADATAWTTTALRTNLRDLFKLMERAGHWKGGSLDRAATKAGLSTGMRSPAPELRTFAVTAFEAARAVLYDGEPAPDEGKK